MIVEAEFYYELSYIPHKKRNARTACVRDRATVEIPEVSAAEAPVAVRLRATMFSDRRGEDEFDDYRYFDGALWRARTLQKRDEGAKRYEEMTAAELVEHSAKGVGPLGSHGYGWRMDRAVALESLMPCRPQQDPDALRNAEIRRLQAEAADHLLVDGIVYARTTEPLYKVAESGTFQRYRDVEVIHLSEVGPQIDPSDLETALTTD